MEFTVHEVVPETSNRTSMGRVVVNPPNVMGPLICRMTAKIFMCCNRAYLTEDSYKKHMGEKKDHGKALDYSKLPSPRVEEVPKISKDYDSANRNLWIVRKKGCAKDVEDDGGEIETITNDLPESVPPNTDDEPGKKQRKEKKCHLCGIRVLQSNFSRHITHSHVPDGVKCDYCSCTFLLNRSRLRHHNSFHGVRIRNRSTTNFKQAIVARAKKQLFSSASVTAQVRKGRRSYCCNICKKECPSAPHLSDHMNTHTGSRPHKCDACGFRFTHRSNLFRHKKTAHTKSDKFFCTICKCGFSANYHLVRHNKAMHPTKLKIKRLSSPKVKISESTDSKKTKRSLPKGEMPSIDVECPARNASGGYICHICQKELMSPQTWRGHMLIHQNLKPYKCQYCGAKFRLHSTRSCHIQKSHAGGKFKCKNCTCSFESLNALTRHTQIFHNPAKSGKNKKVTNDNENAKRLESPLKNENVAGFKCNLCGTVVRLLEDFEEHKKLHNELIRTRCNLCLKEFASSVNVKIHKKRAHGDATISVHKCAFCCCRYTTSQALFQHLVMEHEMDRDDWNFEEKCLKVEARRKIQLKLLQGGAKQKAKHESGSAKTSVLQKCEPKGNEGMTTPKDTSSGYECDICHQRFAAVKRLGIHKKRAHNFGAYPCGLCSCRYQKKMWLEKHQMKSHGGKSSHKETKELNETSPNKTRNVCSFCKFEFATPKGLAAHQKSSNCRTGNFKCKKCPCKFKLMRGLTMHMRRHNRRAGPTRSQMVDKVHVDGSDNEENIETKSDNGSIREPAESPQMEDEQPNHEMISTKPKNEECKICHIKFTHRSGLSRHMRKSHYHSGKFKCLMCPCKFVNETGLLSHKKLHHKGITGTVQKKSVNIRTNKRIEEPKSKLLKSSEVEESIPVNPDMPIATRIRCKQCDLMVLRSRYSNHVLTSHGSGSYSCSECTCVFTKPQGLTRHGVVYHRNEGTKEEGGVGEEEELQSEESSSKSTSKVNLNFLKIRSSSSPKRSSPRSPVKHSAVPDQPSLIKNKSELYPSTPPRSSKGTVKYRFKCELCGIKFSALSYFQRHQRKAHIDGGTPCDSCSCSFDNVGSLAAHKRVYHSGKPGDDVVSMRKSLKKSVRTNRSSNVVTPSPDEIQNGEAHGERKDANSNDKTMEALPNASDSTEHKTRHSARSKLSRPRPSETSQQHSTESNLEHSNPQSTTKLIPCTWCAKAFSTHKLLEKHILSHTRPETCQQCGMRFRNRDEVVKHAKIAHDERLPHQCLICTCRFATALGLKSHHNMIHKKQSASYNNIIIEHDEGSAIDNEPFIDVGASYSQQNIEDDFCEDSEPIVQGILETNYPPNGDYDHQQRFQEVVPNQQEEMDIDDESEPILEGILEYSASGVTYRAPSPPSRVENKKPFSPKFRPMKCSTCGMTCFGPEQLRIHMQSRHQGNKDDDTIEPTDDINNENVVRKCDKCDYKFQSSSELSQHMQSEHDESGLYRCAYCPCTMKTETNLRYHFMKYHSG